MAREMVSLADVKFPDVSPIDEIARGAELGPRLLPLDRRSFLKCAVMAGAVCGISAFAEPYAALLPWAGGPTQGDAQFTAEEIGRAHV